MQFRLKQLNLWIKRSIALVNDIVATLVSWLLSFWLTNNFFAQTKLTVKDLYTIILLQGLIYIFFGLYRGVWRFASIPDLMRIFKAIVVGSYISFLYFILENKYVPMQTLIIHTLLLICILSASRLIFRWRRDYLIYRSEKAYDKFDHQLKRVLIVGAGSAGESIIRDLHRSLSIYQYLPVGIVDDDKSKLGCELHGIRILGTCQKINDIVNKHHIDLILIAIPSLPSKRMREVVGYCEQSKIPFRTLPSLKDIASGIVTTQSLRNVQLEDLLGREQVVLNWQDVTKSIANKTILVTGGGGSIGSELCRQISHLSPKKLIIVDNSEFNLYSIDLELRQHNSKINVYSHLCNITDKIAMEEIFSRFIPDLVFHVAAYKHVPLLENQARVAIMNNVIGSKIVAQLAEKHHVQSFVLISTDKAVNPTSMMGATKRAAEMICQTFNSVSKTRFVMVRFGNVLDSVGSVIPLFRQQLLKGGPLTVTHKEMTRYFMTIPEASQLILQANTIENQGDIFVLDMGEPINIQYLAEQMIRLSGKEVGRDIDIVYTGLRPGEKLYEELFYHTENIVPTLHSKIKQAKTIVPNREQVMNIVEKMELIISNDHDETKLIELLCQLVPEYHYEKSPINQENHINFAPNEELSTSHYGN